MQSNLFYFCGPQGSGKTTLVNHIVKEDPIFLIPDLYSRNVKFDSDPRYRHFLKIAGRAIENFEYLKIAKENPNRIILANRCIFDILVFNEVYKKKEWISETDYLKTKKIVEDFFINENECPNAIVLNPGIEVVISHLEKRWAEKPKKWREDDLSYIELACEYYKTLRTKSNILYIDKEIDLRTKIEIAECINWMKDKKKESLPQVVCDIPTPSLAYSQKDN